MTIPNVNYSLLNYKTRNKLFINLAFNCLENLAVWAKLELANELANVN